MLILRRKSPLIPCKFNGICFTRLWSRATQAVRQELGEGSSNVSYDTIEAWFHKFKIGDFDLSDKSDLSPGCREWQESFGADGRESLARQPCAGDEPQCHCDTVPVHLHQHENIYTYGAGCGLSSHQLRRRKKQCANFLTADGEFRLAGQLGSRW